MFHYILVRVETNGEAGYEINSSDGLVEEIGANLASVRTDYGIIEGAVVALPKSPTSRAVLDELLDGPDAINF